MEPNSDSWLSMRRICISSVDHLCLPPVPEAKGTRPREGMSARRRWGKMVWMLVVEAASGEFGCRDLRVSAAVVDVLVEILAAMWPVQSLAQLSSSGR